MDLYDKKFVYFDWDDRLYGKEVFVADNVHYLKTYVNDCNEQLFKKVSRSDSLLPFYTDTSKVSWKFAYYDPLYQYKKALMLDGRRVQYRVLSEYDGWSVWLDIDPENDGFTWDEKFEYRIADESGYEDASFADAVKFAVLLRDSMCALSHDEIKAGLLGMFMYGYERCLEASNNETGGE